MQLSDEAASLLQDALQSFVLYCKPRVEAPQVSIPVYLCSLAGINEADNVFPV